MQQKFAEAVAKSPEIQAFLKADLDKLWGEVDAAAREAEAQRSTESSGEAASDPE